MRKFIHISVFLAARGISQIGDFMLLIAINIWVLETTHSPTAVSVLWIIPALAQLVVSPWAGSITDRRDKRSVMMMTEFVRTILIVMMALTKSLWLLYLLLFLVNGVGAFFPAASAPYFTEMVPQHQRKRINGIRGAVQSGAIVVGPAITGLIVHYTGKITVALWIDAATFLFSAFTLFVLPRLGNGNKQPSVGPVWRTWVSDFRDAFGVLKQRLFFATVFTLVTLSGAVGVATDSQEVVFAQKVLHLTASQYSLLVSVAGMGYILGGIVVAVFANRLSFKLLIGAGALLGSSGFVIYAFSQAFLMAALGFVVLGVFLSLSSAGFATLYQVSLPVEYMGRIANIASPVRQALIIVCTLLAGSLAGTFGVRSMTISFTLLMLVLAVFIVITVPKTPHIAVRK